MFEMFFRKNLFLLILMFTMCFVIPSFANQIGVTFTQDNIGVLGDYEKDIKDFEFAIDAQSQLSDSVALVANASVQYNLGDVLGLKPLVSYNKDDLGGIIDVGAVVNFSIFDFDVSGGASFRGANPAAYTGEDGFDAEGIPLKYFVEDPSNTYELPNVNNINAVFQTQFEKWKVETGLTTYVPITERELVPTIVITRSQTSIDITQGLGLSLVVDTRSYVHKKGIVWTYVPMGQLTYKF